MSNQDYPDQTSRPAEKPDIHTTLATLVSEEPGTLNATIFYGLSDLTVDEMQLLIPVWAGLTAEHRQRLIQQMIDMSEANPELIYMAIGEHALNDEHAGVREAAIDLLWEDNSSTFMNRLIEMAQWDESTEVRIAAVIALGRFVLQGELGELPEAELTRIQDIMINLLTNEHEDLHLRRRALESIANSSHEIVDEAILSAYEAHDDHMRASALYAMGRTCDDKWRDYVLREIQSANPMLRYEAARASGELEITEAIPQLTRLAQEDEHEIQLAAVSALGEIGGNQAIRVLTALADQVSEQDDAADLMEVIEDAIAMANFYDDPLWIEDED